MAKIMVYGSGHAGCMYAAHLGRNGHDVRLFDVEQFSSNLIQVQRHGGFNLIGYGNGFAPIPLATTNIKQAIDGVEVIFVVVPSFAHKIAAQVMAPYLTENHIVVLNPGNCLGVIEFKRALEACGNHQSVKLAETASSIFACRRKGEADIWVKGIKNVMPIACWPAKEIETIGPKLKSLFDCYEPEPNIVYTSYNINNTVVHPITMLLNTGRIENTKGNFCFYWDGITESVGKCMEALDQERVAISEALGFKQNRMLDLMHRFYDVYGGYEGKDTLHKFFDHGAVNGGPGSVCPSHMGTRYLTEDVPYGIVPWVQTAKLFGVPVPHMEAVVTLASTINNTDYYHEGRTLESLGLADMDREHFVRFIIEGY